MRPIPAAVVTLLCAAVPGARADGCKFGPDGRTVPEREQRAVIEWADGTETLYVATRTDPTSESSVWVVPVRAAATAVRAVPVDQFPAVTYYETVRSRAEFKLRGAIAVAGLLDSGGFCCLPFVGGCSGEGAPAAAEASRVERFGMVVTVVSAETRAGIERYLDAQGVNRSAADLSFLEPYFGGDYAFVCGWVGRPDGPVTATGLKIEFRSPTLWFPLRPTRVYTNPVETIVYTRGYVKPADGCELPGLRCEYVHGEVEARGITRAFGRPGPGHPRHLVPLTRVTLTTDPRKWDQDLELVPGTTLVGTVAVAVAGWDERLSFFLSALLGAVLGLPIPWLTVPRAGRQPADWVAGALTGAAIVFTIWVAALVFSVWRWARFRDEPKQLSRFAVLPALAVAHFMIVSGVCRALMEYIASGG